MVKVKKIKENLLVEHSLEFVVESWEEVILNEAIGEDGEKKEGVAFLKLTGICQKGNYPNGNDRIYKTELLAREVKRFQTKMDRGLAMGKVYHPGFFDQGGPVGVTDVSHRLTKLWMEGDLVRGELLVFKTVSGKDVEAITDGGGRIGISSRGYGRMKFYDKAEIGGKKYKDVWVVDENYRLETFDLVLTPSVPTAIMRPVKNESQDEVDDCNEQISKEEGGNNSMTLEELRAQHPGLYNEIHDAAVKEGKTLGVSETKASVIDEHKVVVEAKEREIGELKAGNTVLTTKNEKLTKENTELKAANEKIEAEKLSADIKTSVTDAISKSTYKGYFKEADVIYITSISDSVDVAVKEVASRDKVYESAIATFKATSKIDSGSKKLDTSEDNSDGSTGADKKKADESYADSQRQLAFG
jgi:hypothetical protein